MKFFGVLIACMLLVTAGCSAQPAPAENVSSQESSISTLPQDSSANEASESSSASDEAQEEAEEPTLQSTIYRSGKSVFVADTALYRGIVEDFSVNDAGETVLTLCQAQGSNFASPKLMVTLTEDTRYAQEEPEYGNGSYLEVFYGQKENPDGSVEALAVNELQPADMILYNGTVKEITPDPEKEGEGRILVSPLGEAEGTEYLFLYSEETSFIGLYLDEIQPGDQLHIIHSPVSTRSLPPQSAAVEIRPYAATEE